MSQVKNLRAMFENKGDNSPPPGQSPGVSISTANPIGPDGIVLPRGPFSKIRTNFVAIERGGHLGHRRNYKMEPESTVTSPGRPSPTSPDDAAKPIYRPLACQNIPESSPQPPDVTANATESSNNYGFTLGRLISIPHGSSNQDQHSVTVRLADTPITSNSDIRSSLATESSSPARIHKADESQVECRVALPRPFRVVTDGMTPISKAIAEEIPIAKLSREAIQRDNKSVNGVSNTNMRSEGVNTAFVARTANPKALDTRYISPRTARKSASIEDIIHGQSGPLKPKPKSLTKPVKIPASLVAPTVSSVSKSNAQRQTLPGDPGSLQNLNPSPHSFVRASSSITSASSYQAKYRCPSSGRLRPGAGQRYSKSSDPNSGTAKCPSQVNEGFLARMMRPTKSSSSKTTDKSTLTPPRKTPPRPPATANRNIRHITNHEPPATASRGIKNTRSDSLQIPAPGQESGDIPRQPVKVQLLSKTSSVLLDAGEAAGPEKKVAGRLSYSDGLGPSGRRKGRVVASSAQDVNLALLAMASRTATTDQGAAAEQKVDGAEMWRVEKAKESLDLAQKAKAEGISQPVIAEPLLGLISDDESILRSTNVGDFHKEVEQRPENTGNEVLLDERLDVSSEVSDANVTVRDSTVEAEPPSKLAICTTVPEESTRFENAKGLAKE